MNLLITAYVNVVLNINNSNSNDKRKLVPIIRHLIVLTTVVFSQYRMIALTDDLISAKLKHIQLEQELNALYCREEIETGNEEIEGA